MFNIKRQDGETEEQLLCRISQQKDENNLTWQDIADIMNKLLNYNYSESRYRKHFAKIKNFFNDDENIEYDIDVEEINDEITKLEKLKKEIKAERIKLQTCNVERNRLDRQEARWELFYEQIGNYIHNLTPPKLENIKIKDTNKKYIQTLADIHMGAKYVVTNNEYSPDITKQRFEILKGETIKFIKQHGLEELTVLGLADAIQGILRYNDLRINDSTVVKAVIDVAELISSYLNDLSAYCNIIYYDVSYGNHSQQRYLGSQANAMMNEDLGYVIGHYIEAVLRSNDRIKVILPDENDLFLEITNIFDFNIIACHGHQIKNLNTALQDISQQRRKFFDYLIMGHLHNDKAITSGDAYCHDTEVLIAPSICGTDEYAESLFKGSKSASAIYGFDEIFGHTETYKIILN